MQPSLLFERDVLDSERLWGLLPEPVGGRKT